MSHTSAEDEESTLALPGPGNAHSGEIARKRTSRRQKDSEGAEDIKIRRTQPDELRRHDISDEELEMLTRDNRDGLSETFWGFVGAGMAALPSAGESLWDAYRQTPSVPLNPLHLIEILIVFGALTGAILIRCVSRGRNNRTKELANEIRSRQAR